MKKILLLCLLFPFPTFASGFPLSNEEQEFIEQNSMEICQNIANITNEKLGLLNQPKQIDEVTYLTRVGCLPDAPKDWFVYMYILDVDLEIAQLADFSKLKPPVLKSHCTNAKEKALLTSFDIKYKYFTRDGEYAGEFSMNIKECKKRRKR